MFCFSRVRVRLVDPPLTRTYSFASHSHRVEHRRSPSEWIAHHFLVHFRQLENISSGTPTGGESGDVRRGRGGGGRTSAARGGPFAAHARSCEARERSAAGAAPRSGRAAPRLAVLVRGHWILDQNFRDGMLLFSGTYLMIARFIPGVATCVQLGPFGNIERIHGAAFIRLVEIEKNLPRCSRRFILCILISTTYSRFQSTCFSLLLTALPTNRQFSPVATFFHKQGNSLPKRGRAMVAQEWERKGSIWGKRM
jgi:hypothetical protein